MRAALLLLPAALLMLLVSGARAQDEVMLGGLELDVQAGYSGYALPIANSALARDWAEQGPLTWQTAFNYSTVPVRITINHRRADALRGRIELVSTAGYSITEDPLGHSTSVVQDFVVPPSMPFTTVLTPRVSPPSNPGGPARLILRIYQERIQTPIVSEVISVTQLEPAYLYSLLLDGPPGMVVDDQINPDNTLGLAMPEKFDPASGVLSTRNWVISCDHRQLTGMPLAARDFAFAMADLAGVREWSAEEQQALQQYVVAGGHLCLFNTDGSDWLGVDTAIPAAPLGRGFVRCVEGGLDQARAAVAKWLTGELEEFVLWCGGSSGGERLPIALTSERLLDDLRLSRVLSTREESDITSHRKGFLHPVWIFREACRTGALEPWQGPEMLVNKTEGWLHSEGLRVSIGANQDNQIDPLSFHATSPRTIPVLWRNLALLLPPLLLLAGILRRPGWVLLLLAASAALVMGWLWWQSTPPAPPSLKLSLLDADTAVKAATSRSLAAVEAGWGGVVRQQLDDEPLVRQVTWRDRNSEWNAGDWELDLDVSPPLFSGSGGGSFCAVVYDAPVREVLDDLPVSFSTLPSDTGNMMLEVSAAGLPAGGECYILTPLGWVVVGGGDRQVLELSLPPAPVIPGKLRMAAWSNTFSHLYGRYSGSAPLTDAENASLLLHIHDEWESGRFSAAEFYALLGALQQPNGHRAALSNQLVAFCLLPGDDNGQSATVLRLTTALGGRHEPD